MRAEMTSLFGMPTFANAPFAERFPDAGPSDDRLLRRLPPASVPSAVGFTGKLKLMLARCKLVRISFGERLGSFLARSRTIDVAGVEEKRSWTAACTCRSTKC